MLFADPMTSISDLNVLAAELQAALQGEVSFSDGTRALYTSDASNYRQVPLGAVIPKTIEDVVRTVEICRKYGVPVLSRGAGTSLAGQCCNVAVVIDFSKHLNKIIEIDPRKRTARVQPGVILDDLRRAAAAYGLTFGPDPATHNRCTLGGMIGNNSCGVHSVIAGKTADNTESLEVLTYEGVRLKAGSFSASELEVLLKRTDAQGEIYRKLQALSHKYAELIRTRYPQLPRRVSGYNLDELLPEKGFNTARALVGSEGTCAVILEATLKLIEEPPFRSLAVLGYPDVYEAADDVPRVLSFAPCGVEGLDEFYVRNMKKAGLHLSEISDLPEGRGWLLVEFGGKTQQEADQKTKTLLQSAKHGKPFLTAEEQKRIWSLRESSFGASVFVPGEKDTFSGFEDSAVPPAKLGNYLRELQQLYDRYNYASITYGHFGDGCIHSRISFDLKTDTGIQTYKRFLEDAADLVVKFGGSFSGEHGDGQNWGHLLHKMYGPELVQAFREFKAVWDPQNKMNPGKVVDSYGADENLRLKHYAKMDTGPMHFDFFEENGDFGRTTERCIGIGKCLKPADGVMCPSYRVTHDEKHSTRGRAHLLHEMMRGEVIQDGWKSEAVKESLDLCLACKACKTECPVKVDMAVYKAEFLSHYYEGRLRPLAGYLFGMIDVWARLASKMPRLANFLTQAPGLNWLAKKAARIAPQRKLPSFAAQTFKEWFRRRPVKNNFLQEVILWPDTFTNHFYPEIGKAAVRALEYAGFRVKLPPENLCCGRPLYDQGMLGPAKEYLEEILNALKMDLEKGISVIGLEPSCVAVFRDELIRLFPGDQTAGLLSRQSFFFAEFLERKAAHVSWPKFPRKAVIQGHCHQHTLAGMNSDRNIYEKLGLDFHVLDAGCCGMAGSFGFEKDHYDVSVKAAELGLLPALEKTEPDTLIISDGFSCREQIRQLSGKKPVHLAEVLMLAVNQTPHGEEE